MSKVSVVIPNYQGEKFIVPCLQSLFAQKNADMTIRIVDNASSDGGLDKMYAFFKQCGYLPETGSAGRVREKRTNDTGNERGDFVPQWEHYMSSDRKTVIEILILSENTGFCHAVNEGIKRSSEEYLFLLNNDTTLEPDCISELIAFMDAHTDAFSAGAKMVAMQKPEIADDCGDYYNALGYAFAAGKGKNSTCYQTVRKTFSACAGAAIYRRALFETVGLFDENHFAYLEDVDIGYRARICGYSNYFVPKAVVYHAGSAVSGSRHNEFKVKLSSKNSVYLVYKNQPILQWLLNLPFLFAGYLIKSIFFVRKGLAKTYIKGILKGIGFCFSAEAREHKVRFCFSNLHHYLKIQVELWVNIFRMFAITK